MSTNWPANENATGEQFTTPGAPDNSQSDEVRRSLARGSDLSARLRRMSRRLTRLQQTDKGTPSPSMAGLSEGLQMSDPGPLAGVLQVANDAALDGADHAIAQFRFGRWMFDGKDHEHTDADQDESDERSPNDPTLTP